MELTTTDPLKLGKDAWSELQAFKNRQLNRREKLNRHKDILNLLDPSKRSNNSEQNDAANTIQSSRLSSTNPNDQSALQVTSDRDSTCHDGFHDNDVYKQDLTNISSLQNNLNNEMHHNSEMVERLLLLKLCDVALKLPVDSKVLQRYICRVKGLEVTSQSLVENLLQKFAHQELIVIEEPSSSTVLGRRNDQECIYVTSADHTKLVEIDKSFSSSDHIRALLMDSKSEDNDNNRELDQHDHKSIMNHNLRTSVPIQTVRTSQTQATHISSRPDIFSHNEESRKLIDIRDGTTSNLNNKVSQFYKARSSCNSGDDLEKLLSLSSTKERESKKLGEELLELLSKPTAKERNLMERFRSADGYQVQEFCAKGTKGECIKNNKGTISCDKLHFKKIIAKHTEESLGDCSFLNTCFHMDSCKYVHYEVDYDNESNSSDHKFKKPKPPPPVKRSKSSHHSCQDDLESSQSTSYSTKYRDTNNNAKDDDASNDILSKSLIKSYAQSGSGDHQRFKTVLYPPQWIQCDLRFFDMKLLGKFSVVMADPPWDIHMELPYGTMSDDEMRKLNIPSLQDEGVIFLWVTGRAMELGRECLSLWGYERSDEVIWVKTNQLQRIIRTGRTGHWLNHGKEHCLVGVKGNPKDINRGLDCDVIVAEVRATSHKPDEIYGIIERLSPGTRKIELFGRPHNVQPNWITLGNQLNGVKLVDPDLVNAFSRINLPYQSDGPI